ncbi:hypothetical protein [Streptomyces sp. NBC_00467]|uniref:hypothetical protein n=1 Tax=Streptomyces sp. NBC_00467 TaxID=2975752 RepID=UPI003FA6E8CF
MELTVAATERASRQMLVTAAASARSAGRAIRQARPLPDADVGVITQAGAQREFIAAHRPTSLLQRLIEPEEIAHLILCTSSPYATTGAALKVAGEILNTLAP